MRNDHAVCSRRISTTWLPPCPEREKVIFYFRFINGMRNICSNDVHLIAGKGFEDKILMQTGIGEENDYDRVQLGMGAAR
jgi:hypothetical protein